MLDLSVLKLLALGVLALIIFGPERLPQLASQAGRLLRDLRTLANRAQDDLRGHLGPEFSDLTLGDLNPRTFIRNQLLDDGQPATGSATPADTGLEAPPPRSGESVPFDLEST